MKRKMMIAMLIVSLSACACGSPETSENSSNTEQTQRNDTEAEAEPSDEDEKEKEEEDHKSEKETEEQIQEQLEKAEEYYAKFDFEQVEACYDKLDELGYDTEHMRRILEYDKSNLEDARKCYETLKEAGEKLESGSYAPLSSLIGTLKETAEKIDGFAPNTDSKIGKYISEIKNNNNYMMLKVQFLESEDIDFDSNITASGYAQILNGYISGLLEEKFPYLESESENEDSGKEDQESKEYTVEDILAELRVMADEVGDKTDYVHVDPKYLPMSGDYYFCFETTDAYLQNTTAAGKNCKFQCRLMHSLSEKFHDFYFSVDFDGELDFDILKAKVSDGKSELEIGQQYIENDLYSMYFLSFNSKNSNIADDKEWAEKLYEMAAGESEITLTFQGAEQEDYMVLSEEQKNSVLHIAEVWKKVLDLS